jgi:Mannosyltransferase (PIG-V)
VPDARPSPNAIPSNSRLPLWVRAVDVISVVIGLVALSVLLFGGFRIWLFEMRLSVMSWWRPALVALVLIAARHAVVRQAPLPSRVFHSVRQWWMSADTRAVLPIHLATRFGVLAIGFLSVVLVGFPMEQPPIQIYRNALLDLPARWDTGWYLTIANEGYRYSAADPNAQQNIAFFPAFPLIVRYLSVILGRQPLWTGVAVSLAAFFWAMVYFLRLARTHVQDEEQAVTAVLLISAYPFALFFSAAYTEALFLLTTVAAVFHFRRGELWQAAGWGFLAGLTRPNGAFLSVVLGLMAFETFRGEWRRVREQASGDQPFRWSAHLDRVATASAPGIGMLVYSTFILFLTGNPFQWTAQNAAWGRVYRSLGTVVTDRLAFVTQNGLYAYASSQPLDMVYLISVVFILVAVWPVYRRFGLPYAVMLLINLLPPMAAGGLLSIGRVTSVLFPAFLWLATAIPPRHRGAWVALFASLQGFAAVLFFTWRGLY